MFFFPFHFPTFSELSNRYLSNWKEEKERRGKKISLQITRRNIVIGKYSFILICVSCKVVFIWLPVKWISTKWQSKNSPNIFMNFFTLLHDIFVSLLKLKWMWEMRVNRKEKTNEIVYVWTRFVSIQCLLC